MSLFKVCTWWSAQSPDILDNYDSASLICCRFGLHDEEKDYVIIGSHAGHLTIFYPTSEMTEEGYFNGYKPTNLLLECNLGAPVLGLTAGRFAGNPKNENSNQLGVLHPFSLCLYNVSASEGIAEHGKSYSLQLQMEYKFRKSAFSVCKGNFGKIKGREFLCVAHMDSTLTFYEQDGISYECTLPGPRSLPSVLAYISRTDSFVRVNTNWELECFSYQDLSQSSAHKSETVPTWSICIGEYALDICPVQITNSRTAIMILGEHNLISISDDGNVLFVIRLDYSPKCFCSFVIGWYWEPNARLITAVVSESSSLLIYEDAKLIWAAQLEESPVAIQRSNLDSLPGGIVTLGGKGYLHIGFLGTEPYVFKVPPLNLQEMNFEKAQIELIELEKQIKQGIDLTDVEIVNESALKELEIEFDVSHQPESRKLSDDDVLMYSGILLFRAKVNLEQIQIAFGMADGVKCSQMIYTFNSIPANTMEKITVWFYLDECVHVPTTDVEVFVSFINSKSIPRVLTKKASLPLKMFMEAVPPLKDGSIKITLTLNSDKNVKVHKLSSIFEEFCEDADTQVIGLTLLHSEDVVTVVAAKNSNRFRIQSDCMETIPIILEAVIKYVQSFEQLDCNKKKEKKRKGYHKSKILVVAPNIPIDEIMQRVENHHKIQEDIKSQVALMDALWNQFKLFQRSLHSKGENDAIDGLMMLIEKNYDDLVTQGDKLVFLRTDEKSKRNDLSCAIALVKLIIGNMDVDRKITASFLSALSCPVEDWTEMSWEYTVAPSFDMLCHQGPLSRRKNATLDVQSTFIVTNFEFDRFKRHMMSLIERVCRIAVGSKQHQNVGVAAAPSSVSKNIDRGLTEVEQSDGNDQNGKVLKEHASHMKASSDDGDDRSSIDDQDEISDWLATEVPPAGILPLGQGTKLF